MRNKYNILYTIISLTIQLIVLFLLFLTSGFYIVSNIHTERLIGIDFLFNHLIVNILAVLLTYIIFYLFCRYGKEIFNKKLYLISIIELSIYFIFILMNGLLDTVSKGNIYLKPIFVLLEFICYLIYLYKFIKKYLTN